MERDDDVVAAEHALGRAHMECDAEHDWVVAIWTDYRARLHASTTSHQCSLDFDRVLCGCQFTLLVWEIDLERRKEKLAEELAWGLYPFDGRDLLVELEKLHEHVAGVEDERVAETIELSQPVMEISDAQVDLGVFPTRDIPVQPMSTKDVLTVVSFGTATGGACLRYVALSNPQLMVSRPKIGLREHTCTTELIKHIINPRQRILVLDGNLILCTIIHAQPLGTILL
jgi:hypothetical protein